MVFSLLQSSWESKSYVHSLDGYWKAMKTNHREESNVVKIYMLQSQYISYTLLLLSTQVHMITKLKAPMTVYYKQ